MRERISIRRTSGAIGMKIMPFRLSEVVVFASTTCISLLLMTYDAMVAMKTGSSVSRMRLMSGSSGGRPESFFNAAPGRTMMKS